ncbi:hypothetical protein ONZ45_g3906 [Pleurotus djamor]|nr:hypothetical protein ONZ45_g3906 [Pleurotus djamor]
MADETIEYLAGPCPASEFFKECIPAAKQEMPKFDRKDYFKDKTLKSEEDLSKHLCNLINGTNEDHPLFDGWKLVNTSNHKDRTSKESTRVDLCLVETAKFDPTNRNNKSITDMELELKFKRADAFNDILGTHLDAKVDSAHRLRCTQAKYAPANIAHTCTCSIVDPLSPFGRGTRGYAAIEVKEGQEPSKPMFLKEQWRAITVTPEAETLKTLKKAEIKHVPTLVCGGDFSDHKTLTDRIAKRDWGYKGDKLVSRVLTRLVVVELGKPLSSFSRTRTLVMAVCQAFLAHRDVFKTCGLLHRDISSGNILILPNGNGLLIDWDLAKEVAKLAAPGCTPERTGTWAFMSVKLSKQTGKLHTVYDDIESFFWVLIHHALRYTHHSHRDVCSVMNRLFNECFILENNMTGGTNKSMLVNAGDLDGHPFVFSCQALDDVLFGLQGVLRRWAQEEARKAAKASRERERGVAIDPSHPDYVPLPDDVASDDEGENSKEDEAASNLEPAIDAKPHSKFINVFASAMRRAWPDDDAAVDYLMKQKKEAKNFVPTHSLTMTSAERDLLIEQLKAPSRNQFSARKRSIEEVEPTDSAEEDERGFEEGSPSRPAMGSSKRLKLSRHRHSSLA